MGKTNLFRRISSLVIIFSLILQQAGFAQVAAQIDLSGYLSGLKSNFVKDEYRPAHLRYFSYNNIRDDFKLLLEKGDFVGADLSVRPFIGTAQRPSPTNKELTQEVNKLLKYFLTGVSLQDDRFWVNLRPDSQDQVIDNWLEKTDVGKIMLEADVQLKKDTAKFTAPDTSLGRKYWDKLYKKAAELYGYDNVTIPTLTRPWIVPGEIIVREAQDSAYVYKAVLKVMLEEDYLKNNTVGAALVSAQYEFNDPRAKELNEYSTQLIRELIIPKLTKEVNSSKRYAALRQVYYSLILSRWFKMRFSGKQGVYSSLINSSNLNNLTSQEPWSKNTYFKQYQKSFSEGEYNIKEPVSTPTGQVIRSYFSGGIQIGPENTLMNILPSGNNTIYEVSAAMPGIVPIQGMANLNLADLRILPMGKAANREIKTLRASKKASSGISSAAAKKETFDLLKDMRVMTVDELDAMDVVGSYSAEDILNDLARTHWTVKKEGKNYCYRPFRLFSQANEKTNLRLLKLLGADGILGGHSEVRKNRKMDNKAVNNLLHQAFQVFGADSRHIMAMGEPLEMRDSQGNLTEEGWEFLDAQVKEGFAGLTSEQIQKIIVGYEPIWSIGTGVTAKPEQAQEVHAAIRAKLPIDIRDDVIIQYGGSMKPDNAAGLMVKVDVGGGLIGGVSLKKESALALINTILNTVREQKKAGTYTGRVPAIVFNLKAAFMDNLYIVELMNIFKFIEDNLSDVDFENIHIGFAVADTDIPLFNRALKGENPQDLVDLSKASLPNKLELAVNIDSVSAVEPGAYTSEITAEALRRAGIKAVIADYSILDTDPRVVRAEAAGLRIVKLNNISEINDLFSLKNQIRNGLEGQVIVIEPALAREAYAIARDLQAEKTVSVKGVSSAVRTEEAKPITSEEFLSQVDYIMMMLGITDYARIEQVYYNSTDPVAFVKELAKLANIGEQEVIQRLSQVSSFASLAAYYRVASAEEFDEAEFRSKKIDVKVDPASFILRGAQRGNDGMPISDYLKVMRNTLSNKPFVFRDDMMDFVGRLLNSSYIRQGKNGKDLVDILNKMKDFLKNVNLKGKKYVFTSGIGSNEMYSHQLAWILNRYFEYMGIDVKWIVVNNAEHLMLIKQQYPDANSKNSMAFEMSRSGSTKETVDFFEATKDIITDRIIVGTETGTLVAAARKLQQDNPNANVLIMTETQEDTRIDIGGRHMNRKTLMVFAPLFLALVAGFKDMDNATEQLKFYVQELFNANQELSYSHGLNSNAVKAADFLFRHAKSGRANFSIVYDESLTGIAREYRQIINEGANKNIAGGTNDNILNDYALNADRQNYGKVFDQASDAQLPIFLLDSSAANYNQTIAYIDGLKKKGIPVIVISVNISNKADLESNLKALARVTAFLQDMAVYFTELTRQDPNPNPSVKLVRELAVALIDIVKDHLRQGHAKINITQEEVLAKLEQKFGKDRLAAIGVMDRKNIQPRKYPEAFKHFKEEISSLARAMNLTDEQIATLFVKSISKTLIYSDVGEAGGAKVAHIDEAFARADSLDKLLGLLTPDSKIESLNKQLILKDEGNNRVSVVWDEGGIAAFEQQQSGKSLAENIATYLYSIYEKNKGKYISLTFPESEENNPVIQEIFSNIIQLFADLGITCFRLPMPRIAHSGVEAVMSHPKDILNVTIAFTNTYGGEVGNMKIDGDVTVDMAAYVNTMANSLRMSMGGTGNVIFEVTNRDSMRSIKEAVQEAMKIFREKIEKEEAPVGVSSAVEAKFEKEFDQLLKEGNEGVIKRIVAYNEALSGVGRQKLYDLLQHHESSMAAKALAGVGINWPGVVPKLVDKIMGRIDANPKAAARQLSEIVTKGTYGGLEVPERISEQAKRVWRNHPKFKELTAYSPLPEMPKLSARKAGVLVLVRHGETTWSEAVLNKLAGLHDAKVTDKGRQSAQKALNRINVGLRFQHGFTSTLSRSIDTLNEGLIAIGQADIPVENRPALRERDYGDFIGLCRVDVESQYGKEKWLNWRRGYSGNETRPLGGENLRDVQMDRALPCIINEVMPLIARGENVVISAHGNSLRGLAIHLEECRLGRKWSEEEIRKFEIPLTVPIVYVFDNNMQGKSLWVDEKKGPEDVRTFLKEAGVEFGGNSVSSSMAVSSQTMPENAGAIDFRGSAMNIKLEATGVFKGMDLSLPVLSDSQLNKMNINSEIQQIKKMVSSGISPSGRHIMEIAAACKQRGKMSAYRSDLLLCIVGACELSEVNADESSHDFMTALAVVDSRN